MGEDLQWKERQQCGCESDALSRFVDDGQGK
jgi:hypothetical protein